MCVVKLKKKPAFRSVACLLLCNMGIPVYYFCLPSTVASFIQLYQHNNDNGTHTVRVRYTTSMYSATKSRLTKSSLPSIDLFPLLSKPNQVWSLESRIIHLYGTLKLHTSTFSGPNPKRPWGKPPFYEAHQMNSVNIYLEIRSARSDIASRICLAASPTESYFLLVLRGDNSYNSSIILTVINSVLEL